MCVCVCVCVCVFDIHLAALGLSCSKQNLWSLLQNVNSYLRHVGSSSLTRDWAGASYIGNVWSLCHSLDHQGSPSFQVWFWVTACLDDPSILQGNLVPGHPPNHSSRLLPSFHVTGDRCLDTAVSGKGTCLFLIPAFVFIVYPPMCYRITESE